jgi:Domain of unknown function (DUF6798)
MIERASITAAIVLAIFAWTWTSDTGYVFDHGNQLVHLVELGRTLDPTFLAHDWFLNAGGEGVRHGYLGTLAALSRVVGVPNAVLLLWLVQIALLAIAGYQLGRALHGSRSAGYLAAILCVLVPGPALADHWLVRGDLNPALVAKALALLALARWLGDRPGAVLALLGAILIHVQVGAQAAGLLGVAWTARAAWRWRRGQPMPPLGRALLAGSMLGGVIVAVLWPMLRSGPALDAEFLQLVVARFRFPWHFIPSCLNPIEVARFALLGLMGLLALRLAGLRRSHWSVAVVLSALALIGIGAGALGRVGAFWHLPWLELTMGAILTALAEGVDLRARHGAAPEAWTERGAEVTAIGAALLAGLVAGVVFVEVVPLALAVDLRLLRLSVFAKALALCAIAGPLARALLRGSGTEAIAAAVATFALLSGEPLPALLGLAVLALAPALRPREAFLWSLAGIALAILYLGALQGFDGRRLALGAAVLVAAGVGRTGWVGADVSASTRERRLAGGALALAGAVAMLAVTAPGLAGRAPQPAFTDLDRLAWWARDHTDRDGIFLVPLHAFGWRRYAERAVVADLGAVPFGRTAMREWLQRVADVGGHSGRAPRAFLAELAAPACAWPIQPLARGYDALGPQELGALATRYGARYVVREDSTPLPWPVLHKEGRFTLYTIPRA